ncbi:MAG TPA: hypothetical protein VEF34_12055 [Syntrophobacteraceae bacterium]|nr:hypothetical protein [Syntrophobacteraceae bacterium]
MKCFIFFLITVIGVEGICRAGVGGLPPECFKTLQGASRFRSIHTAAEIPTAIVALCADGNGRLADPGEPWAATCVRGPDDPYHRLIWAVTDGNYYVVHYEEGGIAHNYLVLVTRLRLGDDKPSFVWRAQSAGGGMKDYNAFLDALRTNKLRY